MKHLENLQPQNIQEVRLFISKILKEEDLKSVGVSARADNQAIMDKYQKTKEALKIDKQVEEYDKDGQKYTRIRTKINPRKNMSGLALYESIPKCLAKRIDDIKIDPKVRDKIKIVNPDPLVM